MNHEENFKESHLRSLYKLLGHTGHYTRLGFLDFSKKVVNAKTGRENYSYEEFLIQGEDKVIERARERNGLCNVFIGRAPRDARGNVLSPGVCTLDLDPVRPKDTASSDEQQRASLEAGRKILGRYPGGYLASSGNGALLVYRFDSPITELKQHYEKEKILFKELQELIGNEVKLDSTYYAPGVIKAIGTFSTKGELSLRRCSQWIDMPIPPYRRCDSLLSRLREIDVTQSRVTEMVDLPTIHGGDRSIADFHLVSFLKQQGAGPAAALVALKASPYGRQTDEKDQARLITKIYGTMPNGTTVSDTNKYFTDLFTPKEDSDADLRTGFSGLDIALGPLPKGELITFAGRSGFGKTTLGCTLAEHWRKSGRKVLYFSTEMAQEYILHKLVSLSCGIPLAHTIQKNFTDMEIARIHDFKQQYLQFPLTICDEFQPTLQLVQNEILKCKPDVIIFDHISQSGTHWEKIAQFARGLKEIAVKENIQVVLLSMLNEPPRSKDGSVGASVRGDVRGSQEIIFLSAIFAMLINPYEVKGRYQPVNVFVAKNRYGVSNNVVGLSVDKEISKFIDRNSSHEEKES